MSQLNVMVYESMLVLYVTDLSFIFATGLQFQSVQNSYSSSSLSILIFFFKLYAFLKRIL
jgi:hypothetical protein